jgi:hypothetical protein
VVVQDVAGFLHVLQALVAAGVQVWSPVFLVLVALSVVVWFWGQQQELVAVQVVAQVALLQGVGGFLHVLQALVVAEVQA